jgi:predicted RNA binding protein YcfA (HicA-like mRNA interferase family)
MKTTELIRRLKAAGCWFLEEGTNHSWWWSPITNRKFQVPRHAAHDIGWNLLKDIEKQSGVKF